MSNTDKVREELAQILSADYNNGESWEMQPEGVKISFRHLADKLLSHPLIRVLAEKQGLPPKGFDYNFECQQYTAVSEAQQGMLKAGYVKVEPKEEK